MTAPYKADIFSCVKELTFREGGGSDSYLSSSFCSVPLLRITVKITDDTFENSSTVAIYLGIKRRDSSS
jgi:hypothetical protein